MASEMRFDGRVVIVTGAGNGLGRSHALQFAARGAKVVVNDLGGGFKGEGKGSEAADKVVAEIKAAGGEAVANYDSVENGADIVKTAIDTYGRIDVVVNNAGILRDVSYAKMTDADWDLVYRVHVLGAHRVTAAAWPYLREQKYGRVIFTASAAGIYGNFGQANYSMAKLGLWGFAQTLALEGRKQNIVVNTIAPIAGSRMTETVLPPELLAALKPELVSPLVLKLAHESNEDTGGLYEVGGGFVAKLRFERTEGALFKIGKPLTPDQIQAKWGTITDFTKATHPGSVTESMQPIMGNLDTAKTRGGNEFIDLDEAFGAKIPAVRSSYDEKLLALYALGIGAGRDPLDESELKYVFEMHKDGFQAFPTFAVIPALDAMFKVSPIPGLNYGFERVLHGEQYLEVKRPLPTHAKLEHTVKVKDIFDKGKNALVVTTVTTKDESGEELAYNEVTTFVRGAGGWGGDRGPSADVNVPPDRAPDAVVTEKILENQALLYRLTGDINPLHADPGFAKTFGFPKPILHGLCTFGFAARAVIKQFAKNDPRFFKSIKVRFAESVFPGETVITEMWKETDQRIVFRSKVVERDKLVISHAAVELFKEIPKPKAAAKPAQAAATAGGAGPAEPDSEDVFNTIKLYLEANPGLAKDVGVVFQFKLSAPESSWILNLKDGSGSVARGVADKPGCTLEIAEADWMQMATGKADPMKLFTGGKLKISGDVMASQKLNFLKKIPPDLAKKAYETRRAGGAAAPAAAPSGGAPSAPDTTDVFNTIKLYLEANPALASQVGSVFQFKLTDPDASWFVDLKNGHGSVAEGDAPKADCTLTLSQTDWMAMATGKADPMKLFTGGALKISGDVMASQKLNFLKKIPPELAKKAYDTRRAGGSAAAPAPSAAPAASAPAATQSAKAPAFFGKLKDALQKNPNLAKEVGATLLFKIKGGSSWIVDLTGEGSVSEGTTKNAQATFELADDALTALAEGESKVKDLYQHGAVRVDGDVRFAHKLSFLKAGL